MAAVAQIVIQVDDAGVPAALQKTEAGLKKVGTTGNVVMTQLTSQHRQASQAALVLSNTLGVQVPRSIERVIAGSKLLGPIFAKAFDIAVIAAFADAIINLVGKAIVHVIDYLNAFSDAVNTISEQQVARNNARIVEMTESNKDLRLKAETVLAGEIVKIDKDTAREREKLEKARYLAAVDGIGAQIRLYDEALKLLGEKADKERTAAKLKLEQSVADAETKLLVSVAGPIKAIGVAAEAEIRKIQREIRILDLSPEEVAARQKIIADIRLTSEIETDKAIREVRLQEEAAVFRSYAETTFGMERLDRERLAELEEITREEEKLHLKLDEKRLAVERDYQSKLGELRRTNAEQTRQIEEDAALATLFPWQRADAQIILDAQRREREIRTALERTEIDAVSAARQTAAVWIEAGARMRDSLAQQLESVFDDITSGNIGRRILNNFKHLFFQILVQWILTMRGMQAAGAGGFAVPGIGGGGGILGSILGGLFPGLGGTGAGGLVIQNFAGRSAAAPGFNLGELPLTRAGGFPDLSGLGISAGGGAGGLAGSLPAGAAIGAIAGRGGFGGLLNSPAGALGIAGGAFTGAQAIGFGSPLRGAASGALLGAAGLAGWAGLAGGNVALSLGALFGGPIGWAVLGISALLGGLFGIFGGRKRRRQAMAILTEGRQQWDQIKRNFEFYQIDFSTATSQISQVWNDMVGKWSHLGGEGRHAIHRNAAEYQRRLKEIEDIETERQRRGAIQFGPAQFGAGGFVNPGMEFAAPASFGASGGAAPLRFAAGGAVPAVLHSGEFVMNRAAVNRIGVGSLQAMNTGSAGGGPVIVLQALDAASVQSWLRRGGAAEIVKGLQRARREGAA